jgi:PmbA protein
MRTSGISDSADMIGELIGHAHKLLALAATEGAEEAEVFGVCGRSADVDLRKSEVELASESFHRGLGLRAVVRGAVGFSSTSDLEKLEAVARSAVKSARARGKDEFWRSLPKQAPLKVTQPENVFDTRLAGIGPEECLDLASSMLQGCLQVQGAQPVSGGVTCISAAEFIVNSSGIELHEKETSMHASMDAIARGDDVSTGSEFHISRTLCGDLSAVGRAAAEMARASLGGIAAESGSFDVILRPLAFTELLEYSFVPSIYADNVQKGRSPLSSKVGEEIFAPGLCMADDGLLAGGVGSSAFDGEGVPSQRNLLAKNGRLQGFLYDSYTAGKAKTTSTGNAVRSGYAEVPRVGIRNLVISSSEAYDIIKDTKGILVNGFIGAHTANPISGDFSVEAKNAFYVAPGEGPRPIRSMMLAGNIFQLLKDIEVGTDVRAVGAVVTPSVKVKMRVVSS